MANNRPPDYLAGLTQLSTRTICGGLDTQEIFYRADEVAALVAKLTAPLADAELADGTISVLKFYERGATSGKWRILFDIEDDKVTDKHIGIENEGGCLVIRDDWGFATQEDFEFICATRNALLGLLARLTTAETKLATIRAKATRSIPQCINLEAIDRVLATETVKGAQRCG